MADRAGGGCRICAPRKRMGRRLESANNRRFGIAAFSAKAAARVFIIPYGFIEQGNRAAFAMLRRNVS